MDYKTLLNDKQYEAVSTRSQFTRIVAGAGSGKTRVLTYRMSYLISEMNVDPTSIVAIAFTNKVAEEMKTRSLSILGNLGCGLSVSTFHSFCAKFLRKEIDVLGFPNNFTIMDEEDQATLIKNIGQDFGYKKNDDIVKYAMGYINYNKCLGFYPEDIILNRDACDREKKALKFFHQYEERKNQMLCLDFDDLLLKTIIVLNDYLEIREKWQNRITNILIDEFQDVNDVQYKLVKLLLKGSTNLYVVGDPDQTIYTWRGANQNIILDFKRNFPGAETIILNQNYRSTKAILDVANKLIANNKKRVPKDLFTNEAEGESVTYEKSFSKELEAKYVVDQIENIMKIKPGTRYSDFAILYRAAYLTLPFEKEMMKRQIPYRIYGGIKFFQRKEIKDCLAYFRLIYNHLDDLAFERIVNVPRRNIGDTTMDILKAEKELAKLSYFDYIDQIEKYNSELKPKHIMALTMLINSIKQIKTKLDENLEAYPKILEDFIREIGYFEYLASDEETNEERVENVNTLFGDIVDFLKKNPNSTFETYLENASLQTSQDEMKEGDCVSMMTIHIAKGLEFPYVFAVCLIEGVFPSVRTMDESGKDGEEEERRLCYVAFTRAKKRLFVTSNGSYSFVLASKTVESRFIKEAGLISLKKDYYQSKTIDRPSYGFERDRAVDYFDQRDKEEEKKVIDNGVRDWKVGDIAIHDVFGRGIVKEVIDETIIVVNFDSCGTKSIMSTHPKIHKEEQGGLA